MIELKAIKKCAICNSCHNRHNWKKAINSIRQISGREKREANADG